MSHSLHYYQCSAVTTLEYYHSAAVVLHFPVLHFTVPHFQRTHLPSQTFCSAVYVCWVTVSHAVRTAQSDALWRINLKERPCGLYSGKVTNVATILLGSNPCVN